MPLTANDRRILSSFVTSPNTERLLRNHSLSITYDSLCHYAWDLAIMSRASNNINMRQLPCPVQYNGGWGSEWQTYNSREQFFRACGEVFHRKQYATRVRVMIEQIISVIQDRYYETWQTAPRWSEIDLVGEILNNYYSLHEDIRALRPRLVITYTQVREAIRLHENNRERIRRRAEEHAEEELIRRRDILFTDPRDQLMDLTGDGEVATELECPICYENIKTDGLNCHVKMPCGHDLCGTCTNEILTLERARTMKCPMCRAVGRPQKQ